MPDERDIYAQHADIYAKLISFEDYQGNIRTLFQNYPGAAHGSVVDLGAGTGRLTRLLASTAASIISLDLSAHMLLQARRAEGTDDPPNINFCVADHLHLPLPAQFADLVVSGWSLCYLAVWNPDRWETLVASAIAEIRRISRPDAKVIILETLGTGHKSPRPPKHLQPYFAFLTRLGFHCSWIRTDYRFPDLETARSLTEFFFGEDTAAAVLRRGRKILPECTAVFELTV